MIGKAKSLVSHNGKHRASSAVIAGIIIAAFAIAAIVIIPMITTQDEKGIDRTLPIKIQSIDTCDATNVDDKVAIWSGDGSRLLETLTASSGVATSTHMYSSGDVVDIYGYSGTDASYYDYYMDNYKIPKAPNDQVSYHYLSESVFMTDAISEANLVLYGLAGGALKCDETTNADWDVDGSDDNVLTMQIDVSAGTGDGLGRYLDLRGESAAWDPVEQEYDFVIFGVRFNSSSTYPTDAAMVGCDSSEYTRIAVGSDMVYFLRKLPAFLGQSSTHNWKGIINYEIQFDFASLTADSTSMAIVLWDNADWNLFLTGAPASDSDGVADDNTLFTGCEIG